MNDSGVGGRRFVVFLYGVLVAFAGVAGYATATFVADLRPPRLFFLVELPPSPVGMAVYGAVTVAVVLGVPLALVIAVSGGDDAPEPDGAADVRDVWADDDADGDDPAGGDTRADDGPRTDR